jgi:hypothetical protein
VLQGFTLPLAVVALGVVAFKNHRAPSAKWSWTGFALGVMYALLLVFVVLAFELSTF